MEYQKMPVVDGLIEIGDIRRAKKCSDPKVRFVLQNRKLKILPKEVVDTKHIPHLELDLSYNKTLDHESTFQHLREYPNLKGLGIIKNEIKDLPDTICSLVNLETLELWSNGLKELPGNFSALSQLTYLNLRNNSFTLFPKEVLALKKLKSLNLRFNKFKVVPEDLFELSELEMLDLSSCKLQSLPPSIGKLKNLKVLLLESNDLKKLPAEIAELQNLTEINIRGNKELDYEQAFEVISHLPNIRKLSLHEWSIDTLPSSIGLISTLEELDIRYNPVTVLPESFKTLVNIHKFEYSNTKLSPESILRVISHWPKLTTIDLRLSRSDEDVVLEIPDSIGDLRYCETLRISDAANISGAISKLSNLKELYIRNCNITELPGLSGLLSLEKLVIGSNANLVTLNESIYTLPNLKVLQIGKNGFTLDISRLHQLKNLEELFVTDLTEEVINAASQLKNLKKLTSHDESVKQLPSSYFNIKSIDKFSFSDFPVLDVPDTLSQLKALPGLHHISFSYRQASPMSFYIEQLQEFKALRSVELYVQGKEIPPTIEKLRHIKSIKIDFHSDYNDVRPIDFSLEYALFPSNGIEFVRLFLVTKKATESLQQIDWWHLTEEADRKIAFALLMGYYGKLATMIQSPFDSSGKLHDAKVFIAGRLTVGTLKSVNADFKSRGATVVKELNNTVTHVLLAPDVPDEIIPELFKHNVCFLLEDHLKAQIIAEDTPYLMLKENEELNTQITRLLKTTDEDNLPLVLEMIEGGGANSILLSYLLAIHLFHDDVEIRKKSRNLFRKYASSGLQSHVKEHWKDSLRDKDIEEFAKLLAQPDVDLCAFILAFKMVRWHQARIQGKIDQYFEQRFSAVRLTRFKINRLTDSMKEWSFVTTIFLEDKEYLDEDFLYDKIKDLGIREIHCYVPMKQFPTSWLKIPGLKNLNLACSTDRCEFTVPKIEEPCGLENLHIREFRLREAGNLSAFKSLTRIHLDNNDIGELDFLSQMPHLESVSIYRNPIAEMSRTFENLPKLKSIQVCHTPLKRIAIDFNKLPFLEELNLSNNAIESIEDRFESCARLRRVNISNNALAELPPTILALKSQSYSGLELDASKNQITSFPSIPQLKKKEIRLDKVDLSHNKIEAVPDVLLEYQNINRIILKANPISKIPHWLGKLSFHELNLEQTEIEEIPPWLFRLESKSVSISKMKGSFLLPDANGIPEHNSYIQIYAYDDDREPIMQFMKVVQAKRKSNEH